MDRRWPLNEPVVLFFQILLTYLSILFNVPPKPEACLSGIWKAHTHNRGHCDLYSNQTQVLTAASPARPGPTHPSPLSNLLNMNTVKITPQFLQLYGSLYMILSHFYLIRDSGGPFACTYCERRPTLKQSRNRSSATGTATICCIGR